MDNYIGALTAVQTEEVYDIHYDTAGNYHWIGVMSGEHIGKEGVQDEM